MSSWRKWLILELLGIKCLNIISLPLDITDYYQFFWQSSRTWLWDPIFESITYLSYREWRNIGGSDLKVLFLLTSFHSVERQCESAVEKRNDQLYTFTKPVSYNKTVLARHAHWGNSEIDVTGINNHFLVIWHLCSTSWYAYLQYFRVKNLWQEYPRPSERTRYYYSPTWA